MRVRLVAAIIGALTVAGCTVGTGERETKPVAHPGDQAPTTKPDASGDNRYTIAGRTYEVMDSADGHVERGIASWYGRKFHGQQTANGERYDMHAMTAAHRELPLPSYVRVENLDNGREITVRVNDRGPFKRNRIIDLSREAASRLGMLEAGTAPVEIRTVQSPARANTASPESTPGSSDADGAASASGGQVEPTSAGSGTDEAGGVTYYVQLGAFAERDNAYRMVGRAEAASLEPSIEVNEHRKDGVRLYRVRIGPVSTAEAVDRVSAAVADVGISETHVVVKDDPDSVAASTNQAPSEQAQPDD